MEDWEARCVASLNKDLTHLLTYFVKRMFCNQKKGKRNKKVVALAM